MLFNSYAFLLFFPVVTILFFLLPHKFRWFHLLVASCIFYMYFVPIYIVILFGTIFIDYAAGIYIENAQGLRRKSFLVLSIITNVGVLAVFKYYNFFIENSNFVLENSHISYALPLLKILLPIGLSFHTFQAMSYTIEVYRGHQKAERHLGIYALYVMFYPQLVAGPIERPQNLLFQFHKEQHFDYDNAANGLRQIMWGLFKKVVIADRLSLFVNPIFNSPHSYSSTALFVGAAFFSFQIFCDFSGYSDIAIGCARLMGFTLMQNFNRPYRARNIANFWRRWHISLSTWFKDYLYIPLGGNRVSIPRWYVNIFIVFIISGLWHGANWTYIIWGALHGFYQVFGSVTEKVRRRFTDAIGLSRLPWLDVSLQKIITFLLVTVAWVFFRASSVASSIYIVKKMPGVVPELIRAAGNRKLVVTELFGGLNIMSLLIAAGYIFFLEFVHHIEGDENIFEIIGRKKKTVRWATYMVFFIIIAYFGVFDSRQFIYFQF
ncbi:MAG: MBOAT family protein [Taibaiella sp.]|nr:MBOAT family protein [Taibaiella sp.]